MEGTSLLSYLTEQDFYMEYSVATLMTQLFQALDHIHGLEIAHLDIEVLISQIRTISVTVKYTAIIYAFLYIVLYCNILSFLELQLSNIMIDKRVLPPVLKLVDFGDACYVAEGSPDCLPQTLPCFEFASPEVLLRQNSSVSSDMWSVGVLIYLLLR